MRRTLIPVLFLLFFASLPCVAGEPPSDPLLRLDPGAHTTSIKGVVTDAAGRFLITASEDKTVRVWNSASGTLLSTLRPPIGAGNEGKLYAVAITPDASLIACAGWSEDDDIYLFNRASGALIKRLTGTGNVINHLAFSASGRFLAASLGGKSGVRLFRTSDWQLIGEDRDFADRSSSVNFAGDHRLVVASYDGFVRLYSVTNSGISLGAKVKPLPDERPFAARFAPNGAVIAIGYRDSLRVSLLSGEDLSPKGEADISGLSGSDMSSVAWSNDGRYLFAGGTGKVDGKRIIRRWERGGLGAFVNLDAGAKNTIMDFTPLPDGRLAVGTADPALTLLAADGSRLWQVGAPIADYRGLQNKIRLAADGTQLLYWYWDSQSLYRLSLTERTFAPDADGAGLTPATASAPGLTIANWEDAANPTLNDTPIQLKQYENSRSLAIAPGGNGFALGTDWSLRFFSRSGEELWSNQVPGTCWAVHITPDARLVVASFGDGTIRWFRVRDGQELLAFFPHADRKRWALWTPSGYYDASPGGEDLIGWHVNNGKDAAADFFSAAKFHGVYYRPDVIDQVLETLDEAEALRMANAATGRKRQEIAIASILPPVATILAPADGATVRSTVLTLRYSARSPEGAPVTGIKILVDGRPISQSRGIDLKAKAATAGEETVAVTIPPRDCEVTLIAENDNAASTPVSIRLKWEGARATQEDFTILPKLYILAVGVSDYADPTLRLGLAAKDAKDFAAAFALQKGLLYREVTTKILTNEAATKDDILDGLDWLQQETTSKDVAAIFLAGHGVNDASGIYYYLPQNADLAKLKRTGVPFSDIKNTIASLSGKSLFFVDTCHSGNVIGGRRSVTDINAIVNELSSAESGAVVFASSTGRQYSLEDPQWGNGAFTKALVEGLTGKADYTGKGKITINMLDLYLSERVKELTGGKQTPTTTKPQTIQDFPIALKR